MRTGRRLAPALAPAAVLAVLLLLAGCGAVDGATTDDPTASPTPTPSPSPTPTATPTPTPAPDGDLAVHFLDVGQGDATLLVAPGATVLVDAGRHRTSDVVEHLAALGVETLDLVAITHPHADHIGQFDRVLDAVDVAEVWWPGATHTTQTFDRALDALEASDAVYEEPRAGDETTVGSLAFEFVNPPEDADFDDLHDSSLAFRVTYGDVAFLFTGDAEDATEERFADAHGDRLAAAVYQAGHHGSRTSTTPALLEAAAPAVAVYSAAAGNSFGHPHPEVVERLVAAGVDVYGTDVHGTVTVTTDGTAFEVATERDEPPIGAPPTPEPSPEPTAEPSPEPEDCEPGQVDLNHASAEELEEIVHIGPAYAEDIIERRPFDSVDDLTRVPGIAEGRLRDIKEQGLACV